MQSNAHGENNTKYTYAMIISKLAIIILQRDHRVAADCSTKTSVHCPAAGWKGKQNVRYESNQEQQEKQLCATEWAPNLPTLECCMNHIKMEQAKPSEDTEKDKKSKTWDGFYTGRD